MGIPGKVWRPLSPDARQIPRRQYNELLKKAESLGGGFSTGDLQSILRQLPGIVRIVESTDSETGGADVVRYDPYTSSWGRGEAHVFTVRSYAQGEPIVPRGERLGVLFHKQSGRFVPISMPEIIRFVIKAGETLVPGGSCTAVLLENITGSYGANAAVEFTIHDPEFQHRQSSPPTARAGAYGKARYMGDLGAFEIISMEHQAERITFHVDQAGGFSKTDATATVVVDSYRHGYEPTTAVTTVHNEQHSDGNWRYEGDNGDYGNADYDRNTDQYHISNMECP